MQNPIVGNKIAWRFKDGPTAGERFEHEFRPDGTLSYWMTGGEPSASRHYECEQISEMVFAVSYLGSSKWTLTSILDFDSGAVTSFASNDKQLVVQHGQFQVLAKPEMIAPAAH